MDVFSLTPERRAFFAAAAAAAARELGLGPGGQGADAVAQRLGGSTRRLRALVDVLRLDPGAPPLEAGRAGPWARLAELVRTDRPLAALERVGDTQGHDPFLAHLDAAGAAPARELAALLAPLTCSLLDLGGGLGTYAKAFLAARPDATATLVDRPAVVARVSAPGLRLVGGDLFDVDAGAHGAALLCNVLHLYGPAQCAALVERAARQVVPGGWVVLKDLVVAPDRSGPAAGVYFALVMAFFTERGDVYTAEQLCAFLAAAGLVDTRVETLAAAADHLVVRARRP